MLEEYINSLERAESSVESDLAVSRPRYLFKHQWETHCFAKHYNRIFLTQEPGQGKTRAYLYAAQRAIDSRKFRKMVVIDVHTTYSQITTELVELRKLMRNNPDLHDSSKLEFVNRGALHELYTNKQAFINTFSNSVVIFEEFHKNIMQSESENEQNMPGIIKTLGEIECKIIFVSATPVVYDANDITRVYTYTTSGIESNGLSAMDVFNKHIPVIVQNNELIVEPNPQGIPVIYSVNGVRVTRKFMVLEISESQQREYEIALQNKDTFYKKALNAILALDFRADDQPKIYHAPEQGGDMFEDPLVGISSVELGEKLNTLHSYSAVFAEILRIEVNRRLSRKCGAATVFLGTSVAHGVAIFEQFLKYVGFTKYGTPGASPLGTYAIVTSEASSSAESNNYRIEFSSKANRNGDKISILVFSRMFGHSISLNNSVSQHFAASEWTMVNRIQATARALRIGSFRHIEEDATVEYMEDNAEYFKDGKIVPMTYDYLSCPRHSVQIVNNELPFDANPDIPELTGSVDFYVFWCSEAKYTHIKRVTDAFKSQSLTHRHKPGKIESLSLLFEDRDNKNTHEIKNVLTKYKIHPNRPFTALRGNIYKYITPKVEIDISKYVFLEHNSMTDALLSALIKKVVTHFANHLYDTIYKSSLPIEFMYTSENIIAAINNYTLNLTPEECYILAIYRRFFSIYIPSNRMFKARKRPGRPSHYMDLAKCDIILMWCYDSVSITTANRAPCGPVSRSESSEFIYATNRPIDYTYHNAPLKSRSIDMYPYYSYEQEYMCYNHRCVIASQSFNNGFYQCNTHRPCVVSRFAGRPPPWKFLKISHHRKIFDTSVDQLNENDSAGSSGVRGVALSAMVDKNIVALLPQAENRYELLSEEIRNSMSQDTREFIEQTDAIILMYEYPHNPEQMVLESLASTVLSGTWWTNAACEKPE